MLSRPLARPLARPLDRRKTPLLFAGNVHPGLVSTSRPSVVHYWNGSTFQEFAANEPSIVNGEWIIKPASTELVEHSTAPENWAVLIGGGTTNTATGGVGALGLFAPSRVASGGSGWHRARAADVSNSLAGDVFALEIIYTAGTSGRMQLEIRDNLNEESSRADGTVGSLSVIEESAGTLTVEDEMELAVNVYRVRLIFTLAVDTPTLFLGIGPDSSTAGGDVVIYGASFRKQPFFDNDWIVTSGSDVTRAADVVTHAPPHPVDIVLYGTAYDGTDYTATPLEILNQSTEWTVPNGVWSQITAEAAT